MKKHLKSVVSFVVALGLAISSVASMAASYSDVASDAGYAESVANLSAIGILTGYDDGTFKPEANITRAEAATVVVRAMAQEAAAKSSQGATSFTDVAADYWASGYINVASAGSNAFINGRGNGIFAPNDNVTYAEMVKMLVAAIGYGDWGIQFGGWPTGYITAAKNLGITNGVTGVNANDAASRGVVAQLTNNAINTPLLGLYVYSPTDPQYELLDGENGRAYETVLTNYHNIFAVEGRVTETNKTSGGSLDADKVKYQIEYTKKYGSDSDVAKRNDSDTYIITDMYVGETDAADYLNVYSKALVYVDDSDEAVILSIVASGKNQIVELDAKGYDEEAFDTVEKAVEAMVDNYSGNTNRNQVYFYSDANKKGKSTRYYLAEDFDLFVNGVKIDYSTSDYSENNAVAKYIFNNEVGKVTLVDTPSQGSASTDGKYDAIFVSYYGTAIVDSVTSTRIFFDERESSVVTRPYIDFDWDDDKFSASFTMDGQEIKYEDIKQGDVLSIAFNVDGGSNAFGDSNFYNIIVSRNVAEGRVSELNAEDGEISIGDDAYGLISGMAGVSKVSDDNWDLGIFADNLGSSYTVYLDAFNRIVDYSKLASTVKYGILHNAYEDVNTKDRAAIIYDTSADKKTLDVSTKMSDDEFAKLEALSYNNFTKDTVYDQVGTINNAYEVEKRVIEYTTNGKGELTSFRQLIETKDGDYDTGKYNEYKAKSNRLAGYTIDDSTVIMSFGGSSITDYNLVNRSGLTDGANYYAFGYDRESNVYPLVLIVAGVGSTTTDSRFAVVEKTTTGTKASNDDDCDKISLYVAGSKALQVIDTEEKDISVDNMKNGVVTDLQKGDVIVYTTNASGEIDSVELIFSAGASSSDYDNFITKNHGKFDTLISKPWIWNPENAIAKQDGANLIIGAVIDKSGDSVTILTDDDKADADGYVNIDNIEDYSIANDAAIYVYDFNNSKGDRLTVGATGSIVKGSIPSEANAVTVDENGRRHVDSSLVDFEAAEDLGIQFQIAVAKVYDDDVITDLLLINPKEN